MFKRYVSLPGEIQARPITLGEYNQLRGVPIPENENPDDEGYLVEQGQGRTAYIPKATFEIAFAIAETPVDCMRNELKAFITQRELVTRFLGSDMAKKHTEGTTVAMYHIQHRLMYAQELIMRLRLEQLTSGGVIPSDGLADLDYSMALLFLKAGFKVARKHWVGKGKYLQLVLANEILINHTPDDKQADQIYYYSPDARGAYTPQQCDQVNEDWQVIFDKKPA